MINQKQNILSAFIQAHTISPTKYSQIGFRLRLRCLTRDYRPIKVIPGLRMQTEPDLPILRQLEHGSRLVGTIYRIRTNTTYYSPACRPSLIPNIPSVLPSRTMLQVSHHSSSRPFSWATSTSGPSFKLQTGSQSTLPPSMQTRRLELTLTWSRRVRCQWKGGDLAALRRGL